MDFVSAVKAVLGNEGEIRSYEKPKKTTPKFVLLPERNETSDVVTRYLRERGISENVIDYCLKKELMYESKKYHNAVFVGYDSRGVVRYAAIRGTSSSYKGEASGSDKHFSFQLGEGSGAVHLFEAAIDALSYASLASAAPGFQLAALAQLAQGMRFSEQRGNPPEDNPENDRVALEFLENI